jgi:4-cresol dehydrogenase (hydroxylating)
MATNSSSDTRDAADAAFFTFLEAVGQEIGVDKVSFPLQGRLTPFNTDRNVGQFPSRAVPAAIRPRSVADVQAAVGRFGQSPPCLYPISTGRNWGLGSFLPMESGAVALDLSNLTAIRRIDVGGGWAEIEPGVTQLGLSKRLAGTDRMLNVTGSSGHTSILGNAMDRGIGVRQPRINDLLGLEIVLPSGEVFHAGWWPKEGGPKAINSLGLGPSLLHLFTQSNIGVATAGVIKLLPRPECQTLVRTTFASDAMRPAIDDLRKWVAQELVTGIVKVYDTTSTQNYGGKPNRNLVLMSISGTREKCAALGEIVASEAMSAGYFGPVDRFDSSSVPTDDILLNVVMRAYAGDPSLNELTLKAATGQDAPDVDAKGNGLIFFLPFIPFTGEAVEMAKRLIDEIDRETSIRAGTTINAFSSEVIELVVSMRFDPATDERVRAAKALELAHEKFHRAGFHPYRLDIEHARGRAALQRDDISNRIISQIKTMIDPNGVIAGGRYV